MKLTVIISFLTLLMSGCTIVQTFDINEDQSGTYSSEIHFAGMSAMLNTDSATFNPLEGFNADSMTEAINKMEGISNATLTPYEGSVQLSYNFSNLTALNNSMNNNWVESTIIGNKTKTAVAHTYFTAKPNTITYKAKPISKEDKASVEEAGGMIDIIDFQIVFNFPHPVKKITNPDYTLSSDKKTATFKANAEKIFSGEASPDFTVKY